MKRFPAWILIWIVTWKVTVMHHGVPVEHKRTARFAERGTADAFIRSQLKSTKHQFTLTEKS